MELASACQAAFWASHAALIGLSAGTQRDALWSYDLALLGTQLPSGLSSKDRAVGLSELQRWREFDARADLDLTEAAATEMIGRARELVSAAEIDMVGLLRRSAGEA